jgi:hypothetical protein
MLLSKRRRGWVDAQPPYSTSNGLTELASHHVVNEQPLRLQRARQNELNSRIHDDNPGQSLVLHSFRS